VIEVDARIEDTGQDALAFGADAVHDRVTRPDARRADPGGSGVGVGLFDGDGQHLADARHGRELSGFIGGQLDRNAVEDDVIDEAHIQVAFEQVPCAGENFGAFGCQGLQIILADAGFWIKLVKPALMGDQGIAFKEDDIRSRGILAENFIG
jgi:hypothetical protein